ncbi:hypothetical protein AB0N05_36100 [Nocardia sp. NPDC051030]|uniref:hypothetical protein n=1 Tax=Nocardia sp. NPDC051030 TaxID=3155162 RepID=UPI0034391C88
MTNAPARDGTNPVDGWPVSMVALRTIAPPFPVPGPSGVTIRTRLKGMTDTDERVLRAVGAHLGSLAGTDLARRCRDGLDHSSTAWADRKRAVTCESSARWAGSITKGSHDQWALARRAQAAYLRSLESTIATIEHRLAQPIGSSGSRHAPGGYRSRSEWHAKSRRLHTLRARAQHVHAARDAGLVSVVRGGKRLLNTRHHLEAAGLGEAQWRERWQARRWFLAADGESGKRWGNETIRVSPDGEVSLKLPVPLAHLANAAHGRYVLTTRVSFGFRGEEWRDRVEAAAAVAYRIHFDVERGRWYVDAAWQRRELPVMPLAALQDGEVIGVDFNADHLAAWRLDPHGNPVGAPRRFEFRQDGTATHRDAQIRHALTRLLHWANDTRCRVIAVENLDFTDARTREKHGRRKRFRQLINGMPTARLRARLVSMAAEHGIALIAVDPAYTSKWGARHWQKPLSTESRTVTRHEAAAVAIARRAQGHRIRRRTPPPPPDRSDRVGHRSVQARPGDRGREGTRPPRHGPPTRSVSPTEVRERGNPACPTPFGAGAVHQNDLHDHF